MTVPKRFFEDYVTRSFELARASPGDEYLAKTAVGHANVMAERMWHYYKDPAPHRVYDARTAERYRGQLADVCPAFAFIRDVAEGFKHVHLRRPGRLVTRADQTGSKEMTWTTAAGEKMTWTTAHDEKITWRTAILIELDDGSVVPLLPVLGEVVTMWDRLTAAS